MSASLFDAGLYLFHGAAEALDRGTGPYLYLPKLESHLEARLWNDVFLHAQAALGVPRGSVRATVLIETILAAFEMDEILYELREHAAGLNAGRWDYMFSIIKRFRDDPAFVLPDRGQVTMAVPFMRAYTRLLVATCHRRGAHAIGGMSAFIPNRREPEVTANALARVREDKEREAGDGFDGTWVAHPDLVPVAREVFDRVLGDRPNQKDGARRARVDAGRPARRPRARRPDDRGRRAPGRQRRHPLPRGLARRQRRRGDRQPDGGRRDRGDLPVPAVAVAAPRGRSRRWRPVHRRPLPRDPGRGAGADSAAGAGRAATSPRRPRCSTASSSTTSSRSS